jgi:hypothetical protein
METPTVTPAVRKGFFRRLISWRGILFLLAAFITLVALLLAEENWRGGRAWQNYKHEMEAKGERFDAARLIPPTVPDSLNLAMIPFFTNINGEDIGPMTGQTNQFKWPEHPVHPLTWRYGWAEDLIGWARAFHGPSADSRQAALTVVNYLNEREPVLTELASSASWLDCRFNIRYKDWEHPHVENAMIQQLSRIKQLIRVLSLRAQAQMVSGRTDKAIDDINVMFQIDAGLKDEPLLISQLVRMAAMSVILQPVGEGLAEQRWSDAQLRILQERLQKTDLIASTVQSSYGERDICVNQTFDRGGYFDSYFPHGWARLEQLNLNRAFHDMVFPRIDLAAREINPRINQAIDASLKNFSSSNVVDAELHHSMLARMSMPGYSHVPQKVAFAQSEVDMAMLACALERYRLAEGHYPEELNALAPRFVAVLPHDIINGEPLKYRRTGDGRFILYSVGWNEKDDGGIVAMNKDKHQDVLRGDWVWQYPGGN